MVSTWLYRGILVAPVVVVGVDSLLLAVPATRDLATSLHEENHPIEVATFLFLVTAGFLSLVRSAVARRRGEAMLTQLFYLVFGIGLVLVSLEEIAWGQYWLGFQTPAGLADLNVKGEATLHNIAGIDSNTELLRVMYGVGGLIGVWLARRGRLPALTPPEVLWTWFLVISVLSIYDLANDLVPLVHALDTLMQYLDELTEMLIGLSALIFVAMKMREDQGQIPARA